MCRRTLLRLAFLAVLLGPQDARAQDATDDLTQALATGSSARVRAQAALALQAQAGDPAVQVALVGALRDPDPIVRAAAAKAFKDAAPADAFPALSEAAWDPDPLVAKWAARVLRRIVARARVIVVDIRPLSSRLGVSADQATKSLQSIVLERLLVSSRFDVPTAMDFGAGPEAAVLTQRPVRVSIDGEAVPAPAQPGVEATVEVRLRVTTPSGHVVWEGGAVAGGRMEAAADPDPDSDAYTIRDAPTDARLVALREAARKAADELARALDADGTDPGPARSAGK